jgi:enediyne biosynthesis protein E4
MTFRALGSSAIAVLFCAVLMFGWVPALVEGFQGVSSAMRPAKAANIRTQLPPIQVDFRDLAKEAGLTAINVTGGSDQKSYILETTGGGVALFDFDNDGRVDVFVVNGTTMDGTGPGEKSTSHLYRNLGNLRFEDVTSKSGLVRTGWGQGACAGDYDNDGLRDLFATYYGHSVLYRNQGGGVFRDVTKEAGLRSDLIRYDTGCSFVDYDLDGKLDLMFTGYLEFDRTQIPEPGANSNCRWKGVPVLCGPRGLAPGRNLLFHNQGGGRFVDVSAPSGIGKPTGCYGFTVVASDFDNDGYPDLYVACDSRPSLLYHNQKDGTFEEMGIFSGTALNEDGQEQAGMGVAVADYDEDGYFDILKTNFSEDTPNLFHNSKDLTFSDKVYGAGLGVRNQFLGWGALFLDADHDGRKDILLVNGHVFPEVNRMPVAAKFRQQRLMFWNVGGGQFKDLSDSAGPGIGAAWSSRGAAAGDLDNDGSLEVVINNLGDRPSLLKNFGTKKNWLLVQLRGVKCNRDAVGARAYVFAGVRKLSGEVQSGSSFLSQNDSRLHFGLADDAGYGRIEVKWPGGETETFPGGAANKIVLLEQGKGSLPKR